MRKSRLYRGGAAFLAALIVFTGMPQGQMYVSAQESGILTEVEENQEPDQIQTATVEEPDGQEEQEDDVQAGDNEGSVGQDEYALDEDVQAEDLQDGAEDEEVTDEAAVAPQADDPVTYTITGPTKRTYLKGEPFDSTGAQIKSSDNKTIPIADAEISFDSSSAGMKKLTITYGGKSADFNVLVLELPKVDAEYGQELSEVGLPPHDNGKWEWKKGSERINKAGKLAYQVEFTPTDTTHFQSRTGDAEVNVTCDLGQNAYIELSIPSKGYTYDGTEKKPEVTVSVGGSNLLAGKDYTVSYKDNVNAGTDTASVVVTGTGNYKGEKEEKFSIAKARLIIRASSKTIYCGDPLPGSTEQDAYQFEYTSSGLAEGDTLTGPKFTCGITDTEAAGTYDIIPHDAAVSGDAAKNYEEIEYIKGTLTVQVFVPQTVVIAGMPSELDTTYDKTQWPHGSRAVVRISGATTAVTNVTAVPHYTGTTAAGEAYDKAVAPTEAGDYVLTYTLGGKDKDKYALRVGSDTFPFVIKQKEITITAPSKTVAAGESVPEANSLKDGIQVTGFLRNDSQSTVLDGELSLKYSEENISSGKSGTYDIIPVGVTVKDMNYTLVTVNGTLTVEGRKAFEADFTSIRADDKTYDGLAHSISGYASDESSKSGEPFTYTIQVTDETRKREAEKNQDQDGDDENQNDESQDESGYIKKVENVPITEIVQRYKEIAPVDVGRYKLEIFSEVKQDVYEYDGEPLMKRVFYVTLLQKREMKLAGVTGITDKEYNGEPVDFSNQITNAKLLTNQGVDVTENAELTFAITGTTSTGADYSKEVDLDKVSESMPQSAGKYELHVKLVEKEPRNYVENEWIYPFEIKRRKISITVKEQEMHVGEEGIEAGAALPDRFGDQYQVEGLLEADEDDFKKKLSVVLPQAVEANEAGVYDLVLSGLAEADWPDYEITWTGAKLTVKGQLHKIKEELKAVTNVPNGTTLEEIAGSYLPKKTTIYLYKSGKAPKPAASAGKDDEESSDEDIEMTAEIVWDTTRTAPGTSYNINTKTPQTFKMTGTVQLPELVYADPQASLTVAVSVSVREAYDGQALKPSADIKTGLVSLGTVVRLSTTEENAEIIYTIQADNPAFSLTNKVYTEPIEIRSTMTIRAIARVKGKRDSEELRVTYYLDKTLNPGGNDPNNPDPDVPLEDIPKDENGKPTKIPEGLWVTDVTGYIYTGKAIKPEVRVYDYKTRLEEKKDYTISYKNNINAADKASAKAPTITVTGKGNYEGKLLKTFTISPKDISDPDVKTDDLTVAFNGKAQKPVPVLTWNGKKLAANKDYSYDATPQTAANKYPISLVGTGNYTGKRNISFEIINDGVPVSKLTVAKIPAQTYTGSAIKPELTVKFGKDVLAENRDYTLSYEDNVEVGTASVIITGTGKDKMSRFFGVKRVTFSINAVAVMSKAKAELLWGTTPAIYTGKEITASDYLVTVQVNTNGVTETRKLVKDKDYKVTYQNNVKAGNATAVFEGINAYSGTLKKTFKISAYDLQMDPNKKLNIQVQESYPYMKGGSTQKPVVKFDGKVLTEGTDYTLAYKNHTAAGNYAAMTIKGKGNFTGSVLKGYTVTVQNLKELTVSPADKAYQAKANSYQTKVQVLDSNGKALSAGKDYDKNFIYTYERATKVNDATTGAEVSRKKGDVVAATDLVPAMTEIRVTVNAAGTNYEGTASGTYRIGRASLANAKVTIPTQTYTGKAIEPKETEITVVLNGMVVSPQDYKIISYTNNVNKGTAKLTIQGQGENYGGTKTVSFKIKSKSLLAQIIG